MIQIENLTKRYGAFTAVDDITFTARAGRVTGFLGPNGAGKSTAMRMMVGLTTPTSGTATVLGRPYRSLPTPSRHVGVMLDATAQHPGRTGRETLFLAATMAGLGRPAVDAAIERVGLTTKEAGRRVGNYSLGMRQRLGLAGALIGDPRVLILDEPANGLDPAGIRWMRGLLREYAAQGGTVLLSSHLLHEVEQIAQDLVMIGRGRIVAHGAKDELLRAGGTIVDSPDRARLGAALEVAGWGPSARPEGGFVVAADAQDVARLGLTEQLLITELRSAGGGGLEDMFLQLTADDAREGVGNAA
ncbi:ABC-2 type transport system ATP-binding protein [Kineosphaera limosa]|uniref:Putative ABC transporter ATP-binding protein n=1 Tax=Kineosphaera limosa NBRC 100340 TaxID=1184609 RepID=K6X9S1_9MICO|nr:ATP-binding cassette domain-containing protein [Kineosphaera limosa]NYD99874.1 ABC-2 type transport system ATP-binding protein [Kineosphaera limosa]GAB95589.1 putative ABC transporter ATP-binding protein [Kineosphaera limosa NBRC 100340]